MNPDWIGIALGLKKPPASKPEPLPDLTPLQMLRRAYLLINTNMEFDDATRAAGRVAA
jgi:hypothetical protein